MVVLTNNSCGTIFTLYRDDEGDTEKWKVRLFLEKDRGEVGRMSRVAPPVVIREELAHRSPGHLTGYHLPKEKRSGIEKNGRDERKVWSGRPEPELPISCARLGIRLRHSGKEAQEPRSYGAIKRVRIFSCYRISFTFYIKRDNNFEIFL